MKLYQNAMTEKWIVLTHKKSKKYIDNHHFYFIL